MVDIHALVAYADNLLQPHLFRDYAHNGLQLSGKAAIQTLVSGVSVNAALIDAAIMHQADALLVHHGIFWDKAPAVLTGVQRDRVARLLAHDINVLAYHLPLDAHATLGNNVLLAQAMGWQVDRTQALFNQADLLWLGQVDTMTTAAALSLNLAHVLGQQPIHAPAGDGRAIKRVAWCTGAAQDGLEAAAACGVDAYISGEISERTYHLARELSVHYFAVGHHASETFGVQALGAKFAEHFGLQAIFCDIPNPI
jgi:dinuclear metal center YbgI/SA1388 family protein